MCCHQLLACIFRGTQALSRNVVVPSVGKPFGVGKLWVVGKLFVVGNCCGGKYSLGELFTAGHESYHGKLYRFLNVGHKNSYKIKLSSNPCHSSGRAPDMQTYK